MRAILFSLAMFIITSHSIAQVHEWSVINGRARLQSVILVPEKDAGHLYKLVNRWLVATFKNPEDALKARIESEYLRGEGYYSKIFQIGALSSVDFQYTFSIEVKDGKVRLTFSNGIVLYDDSQDTNGAYPIELYLENLTKKKRDQHSQELIASINSMSATLAKSLETFLITDHTRNDDW